MNWQRTLVSSSRSRKFSEMSRWRSTAPSGRAEMRIFSSASIGRKNCVQLCQSSGRRESLISFSDAEAMCLFRTAGTGEPLSQWFRKPGRTTGFRGLKCWKTLRSSRSRARQEKQRKRIRPRPGMVQTEVTDGSGRVREHSSPHCPLRQGIIPSPALNSRAEFPALSAADSG